jgi:hypothetical protein
MDPINRFSQIVFFPPRTLRGLLSMMGAYFLGEMSDKLWEYGCDADASYVPSNVVDLDRERKIAASFERGGL